MSTARSFRSSCFIFKEIEVVGKSFVFSTILDWVAFTNQIPYRWKWVIVWQPSLISYLGTWLHFCVDWDNIWDFRELHNGLGYLVNSSLNWSCLPPSIPFLKNFPNSEFVLSITLDWSSIYTSRIISRYWIVVRQKIPIPADEVFWWKHFQCDFSRG